MSEKYHKPFMQNAIQTGITLGLTLAILTGPVFFALIQTALHKGFWKAFVFAIGISLSDAVYILFSNLFVQFIEQIPNFDFFLSLVGGVVLGIIGYTTFRKQAKPPSVALNAEINASTKILSFFQSGFKGFIMNFAHPGVLIFWLAVVASINTQTSFSDYERGILYFSTIVTVLSTDILKAFLSHRISNLISIKNLTLLNKLMGIVLMGFSVLMFLDMLGIISLTDANPAI